MKLTRTGITVIGITSAIVVALSIALGLFIWLSNTHDYGGLSDTSLRRLNIGLISFAFQCGLYSFAAYVAIGVYNKIKKRQQSVFYIPFTLMFFGLFIVGVILGLNAFDRLVHDLRVEWLLTDESEIQIFNTIVIASIFAAAGAGVAVAINITTESKWLTWSFVASVAVISTVITVVAFIITGA